LKSKLDSINLLEESQVEMVDFQVRKHTKNLQRIVEIEARVRRNNEDLGMLNEQMKAEINTKLQNIIGPKVMRGVGACFCVLLVILVVITISYWASYGNFS